MPNIGLARGYSRASVEACGGLDGVAFLPMRQQGPRGMIGESNQCSMESRALSSRRRQWNCVLGSFLLPISRDKMTRESVCVRFKSKCDVFSSLPLSDSTVVL